MVVNPQAFAGLGDDLWPAARAALAAGGEVTGEVVMRGDGGDVERVRALVAATAPGVVVAAGGDGTVSEVVDGMRRAGAAGDAAALGIVPLGTANNAARSLGLPSVRVGGRAALAAAIDAVTSGTARTIDLGRVGDRAFVGSFALGMDADILVTRNRLRRRFGLGRRLGGYPLYLWSCAVNVIARRHGGPARLEVDGGARTATVYDLLVTNTPLYAGEFRFDGPNDAADGRLDLHVFTSAADYVREFVAAWRRHVHFVRGAAVRPTKRLERVRRVRIALAAPAPSQVDGEEGPVAAEHVVTVAPGALVVRVPHTGR